MNIRQTILLATIFAVCFSGLIAADQVLLRLPTSIKHIVLAADNEQFDESQRLQAQSVLESAITESDLESVQQWLQAQKPLVEHPLLKVSNDESVAILTQLSEFLSQQKAYLPMALLGQQLTLEQRLQAKIQFRYAMALAKQSRNKEAIQAYQDNMAFQPNHQATAINLGLLLNKAKRYDEAKTVLYHAVDISASTRKAKALSVLASSYAATENLKKAVQFYEASIQYRPDHAITWYKLAKAKQASGLAVKDVVNTYQRALALKPDYHRAAKALGLFQLQAGLYEPAIDYLQQALAAANRDQQLHQGLAWCFTELGQMNAARKQWAWLANNAATKTMRLQAAHFEQAISNKSGQLKPLPNAEEFRYTQAVLAQLNNDHVAAKALLQQLDQHPLYHIRAQHRLDDLGRS